MIATSRNCLKPDEVRQVVRGGFADADFESVLAHLDDCPNCRESVENVEREGDWIVKSLTGQESDPLQAETACQVAMWRMMETPPTADASLTADGIPIEHLGPYRLLRALGAGGMGTVYLGEHERLRRQCAIKLLPRERVDQPGWLSRFDREMTTVASLEHPNVVRATDAGHQDGWHYLVMEHLDGLDVGRIVQRMGQLEVADACEIVRQAAMGLAHVHASGLVHRDVKPSNLMLTRDGVVKLLDLGLVLSGDDPLTFDDRLTTVGHLMGTMPYMSPEQLIDSRDVSHRADIYALGATLYRLIAGTPPHPRRGGLAKHVMAITSEDPLSLDRLRDDVDTDIVQLVAQMLARDPAARPNSAAEIAQRLETIGKKSALRRLLRQALRSPACEEPVRSLNITPRGESSAPPPRKRLPWTLAFFFAAILVFGFVLKIATDRGDLIINSPQDDLIVAVLRGQEVVERLEIVADKDNRITLRKGTYRIEIEGAGENWSLSKNVITIGRGETRTVNVQNESADSVKTAGNASRQNRFPRGKGTGPHTVDPFAGPNAYDPYRPQSPPATDRSKTVSESPFADAGPATDDANPFASSDDNATEFDPFTGAKSSPSADPFDRPATTAANEFDPFAAPAESLPLVSSSAKSAPSNRKLLYQGKNIVEWSHLLIREQDPRSLGEVMRAVEVLTRDSNQRSSAARVTLRTARQWGGYASGGLSPNGYASQSPSEIYMAHLLDVFPNYFPEDGVIAINEEFKGGNAKSRTASIWLLRSALHGNYTGDFQVGGIRLDKEWAVVFDSSNGRSPLSVVYESLREAIESSAKDATLEPDNSSAKTLGLRLALLLGRSISKEPWVAAYVKQQATRAISHWETRDPIDNPVVATFGQRPPALVTEDVLFSALQMQDKIDIVWPWAAYVVMHPQYLPQGARTESSFDEIAEKSPNTLFSRVEARLALHFQNAKLANKNSSSGAMQEWMSLNELVDPMTIWPKAIPFYADQADQPTESLERMTELRETLSKLMKTANMDETRLKPIDQAIETLKAKTSSQSVDDSPFGES